MKRSARVPVAGCTGGVAEALLAAMVVSYTGPGKGSKHGLRRLGHLYNIGYTTFLTRLGLARLLNLGLGFRQDIYNLAGMVIINKIRLMVRLRIKQRIVILSGFENTLVRPQIRTWWLRHCRLKDMHMGLAVYCLAYGDCISQVAVTVAAFLAQAGQINHVETGWSSLKPQETLQAAQEACILASVNHSIELLDSSF